MPTLKMPFKKKDEQAGEDRKTKQRDPLNTSVQAKDLGIDNVSEVSVELESVDLGDNKKGDAERQALIKKEKKAKKKTDKAKNEANWKSKIAKPFSSFGAKVISFLAAIALAWSKLTLKQRKKSHDAKGKKWKEFNEDPYAKVLPENFAEQLAAIDANSSLSKQMSEQPNADNVNAYHALATSVLDLNSPWLTNGNLFHGKTTTARKISSDVKAVQDALKEAQQKPKEGQTAQDAWVKQNDVLVKSAVHIMEVLSSRLTPELNARRLPKSSEVMKQQLGAIESNPLIRAAAEADGDKKVFTDQLNNAVEAALKLDVAEPVQQQAAQSATV